MLAAILLAAAWRARTWRRHTESSGYGLTGGPSAESVDPLEVAYLNGGPYLTVLVACLQLYRRGVVALPEDVDPSALPSRSLLAEMAGARSLTVTGEPVGGHPLEKRTFEALSRSEDAWGWRSEVRASREMDALRADLIQKGLLVDQRLARRVRLGGFGLVALLGLGAARWTADAANDQPVGLVVLAMAVTALALLFAWRVPDRTPQTQRMLRELRDRHPSATGRASLLELSSAGPDPGSALTAASGRDEIDPMAVAAVGSASVWSSSPGVAASFGFTPPVSSRRTWRGTHAAGSGVYYGGPAYWDSSSGGGDGGSDGGGGCGGSDGGGGGGCGGGGGGDGGGGGCGGGGG